MDKPHAAKTEHAVNRSQDLVGDRTELVVKGGYEAASQPSETRGPDRSEAGRALSGRHGRLLAPAANSDDPADGENDPVAGPEDPPLNIEGPYPTEDDLAGVPREQRIDCYALRDHVLYLIKNTRDGEVEVALSNFAAIVEEERAYDDGEQVEHRSLLRVTRPGKGSQQVEIRIEIPTAQFAGMSWVATKLGHRYVVGAGSTTKDHLRAAIQQLSHRVRSRCIYAHTGWRHIEGQWCFLHSGGAITANGLWTDLEVELPDNLALYDLPSPPMGERLRVAVRASLRQLDLVDDGVGAMQLARVYAPPAGEFYRLDTGTFVAGRTGSGKSELAALAMAHYGGDSTPGPCRTVGNPQKAP